jgi:hypothetical protein
MITHLCLDVATDELGNLVREAHAEEVLGPQRLVVVHAHGSHTRALLLVDVKRQMAHVVQHSAEDRFVVGSCDQDKAVVIMSAQSVPHKQPKHSVVVVVSLVPESAANLAHWRACSS